MTHAIDTAYVKILPDMRQFGATAKAQINKSMSGVGQSFGTATKSVEKDVKSAGARLSGGWGATTATVGKQTTAMANTVATETKRGVDSAAKATSRYGTAAAGIKTVNDKINKSFSGMGATVKQFAAIAAGAGIVGFLRSSISAASDLNETQNKSNVIFKENAAEINKWASNSATQFGLSKRAALDAASGFGDMFSQLGFARGEAAKMSEQTVQLATDLGSFNNLPTAEVIQMISASFRGEYDSLQRVIPNISAARVQQEALNETHKSSVSQLTAAEKATATLTIIQQDGSRAAGDFERTSGGLANQQKILAARFEDVKAKVGDALLPVMITLVGVASDLLGWFSKYSGVLVPLIGIVAGLAVSAWAVHTGMKAWRAVTADISTILGFFKTKVVAQTVANDALAVSQAGVASTGKGMLAGMAGMSGPLAIVITAATAAFFAFDALDKKWDIFTTHIPKGITGGIDQMSKALIANGGVVDDSVRKSLGLTFATTDLKESFAKSGLGLADYTTIITGNQAESERLFGIWTAGADPSAKLTNGVWQQIKAFRESSTEGKSVAATMRDVDAAAGQQIKTLGTQDWALQQVRASTGDMNLTMEDAKKKYTDAIAETQTFTAQLGFMSTALDKLSNDTINSTLQQFALTDALGTLQDNWAATRAQVDAHTTSLDKNTADGRANQEWMLGQILSINQQALTYAKATGDIHGATTMLGQNTDALVVAMHQAGFTDTEVRNLINTYGATPGEVETAIKEEGSAAVLASLGDILNQLHAIADPDWGTQLRIATEENNPQLARLPPGAARGGLMKGPGSSTSDSILARVSTGEYIVNAAATRRNRALLESINKNKFAWGGQVGRIPQIARIAQAAGATAGSPANVNITLPDPGSLDIKGWYDKQVAAAREELAKSAGIPGNFPGSVLDWTIDAVNITGTPASWIPAILRRINFESGGNPNAINLTDTNAQAGDPSRGLMQTIGATFNAYHQPGTSSNIYDPVANIAAAINYIKSRYGSIFAIDPPVQGYKAGAWKIPDNRIAALHKGEMVLPPAPAAALRASALTAKGTPVTVRLDEYSLQRIANRVAIAIDGREVATAVSKYQELQSRKGVRR